MIAQAAPKDARPELVRLEGITKKFPGVTALNNVDFELLPGEVHVLFGENGAGKSTLIKILSGVYQPDAGQIHIEGQGTVLENPHAARLHGIGACYQEFSLVPQLSVVENLFLGRELKKGALMDKKRMFEEAQTHFHLLGMPIDFDLNTKIEDLDTSRRQIVEIVKALLQYAKVLILDEPSNALNEEELESLFNLIQNLKEKSIGIIYISHRIEEIRAVADRVTVLRDGRKEATLPKEECTDEALISLVTGKKTGLEFPPLNVSFGETLLEMQAVTTKKGLENINLTLRAGEILGIGGLMGSGKAEIGRTLFGLDKIISGEIIISGNKIAKFSPINMLKHGLVYFPADKHKVLIGCRSLLENQTILSLNQFISRGLINKKNEQKSALASGRQVNINPLELSKLVSYFSGGNQKKVLISRALLRLGVNIFVFDEVTHGIDVGAKMEIFKLVNELAEKGAGVVYISSELEELLHLTHRILAMHQFRIISEVPSAEADRQTLLYNFFGMAQLGEGE